MIFARKYGRYTYLVTNRSSHAVAKIWWNVCWILQLFTFFILPIVSESQSESQLPHIERGLFHTPWIPKHFLSDYIFNSVVKDMCPNETTTVGGPAYCRKQKPQSQCLALDDGNIASACGGKSAWMLENLESVHLRFCAHYNLNLVLDPTSRRALSEPTSCKAVLESVKDADLQAQRLECEFHGVLARYDCSEGYSVNWNCTECRIAYRSWVCSMLLPVYVRERLIKPCRSFCHQVEQRCPYFHPFIKEQYAGEPVFKCIDRNIPDIPSITPNTAYGRADECYRPCHLHPDLTPRPTECDLSLLPSASAPPVNNSSGPMYSSASVSLMSRPVPVAASLLLWWALGFRIYRTPGRTKRHLWREPT